MSRGPYVVLKEHRGPPYFSLGWSVMWKGKMVAGFGCITPRDTGVPLIAIIGRGLLLWQGNFNNRSHSRPALDTIINFHEIWNDVINDPSKNLSRPWKIWKTAKLLLKCHEISMKSEVIKFMIHKNYFHGKKKIEQITKWDFMWHKFSMKWKSTFHDPWRAQSWSLDLNFKGYKFSIKAFSNEFSNKLSMNRGLWKNKVINT